MRTKPRILVLVVSTVLALALMPGIAFAEDNDLIAGGMNLTTQAASDHTADDAINWAKSKVGTSVGYNDGSGYYQCVEFIQAYYQYLGVSPVSGNGCDYASNALPTGWTRTAGGQPQKGDILVYGAYGSQTYGHVAIYESDNSLYDQDGSVWGATVKHESKNYRTYTWAYWGCIHPNFSNDHSGPSYSDFKVAEIEDAKFTVMAKVSDSSGIQSVRYAVWTEDNGQDELVWYDGHCTDGNGVYWAHIPYSEHKNEKGNYIVHMYAYDNAGNLTTAGISYRFDAGVPTVTGFHTWELKDSQFTVSANITSPNGIGAVRYAVWTEYNGQDDLVWRDAVYETTGKFYYVYVPFSEHNNERGNYIIHLYAYDTGGKLTNLGIEYVASLAVPSTTVAEGTYTIRSKLDTSMCLDVAGHSMDDKANVWLWGWNSEQESGPTCEKFQIKSAGDGSYYIIATHSDKAVEVYGAYADNGANISQYTQNQTAAQRWYFVKNDNGTYTIRNKATGHVMDVENWQTASGTNVSQYPYHSENSSNQEFYLVPIDVSEWDVSIASDNRTYTGNPWEPEPTVTAGGVAMKQGTDYTVSYENNVNAGTATVIVTGKGGFTGSKSTTFTISAVPSGGSQGGNEAGENSSDGNQGGGAANDGNASGGFPGNGGQGDGQGGNAPGGNQGNNPSGGQAGGDDLAQCAGAAKAAGFTDLDANAWYMGTENGAFEGTSTLYLDYAVATGLMSGYKGTTRFGPDDNMSRAMVATVIYRMAHDDISATTDPAKYEANDSGLTDVEDGAYYTAAVNWCVKNGVITGYESGPNAGKFCPYNDVTREELATITGRYCTKVAGLGSSAFGVSRFSDAASITEFAKKSVAFCAANKIVGGYTDGTGRFDPQGKAKRCQGAKIFAVTARLVG